MSGFLPASPGTYVVIGGGGYAAGDNRLGLVPLHRKARLIDISFMKFARDTNSASYTGTITLTLVVIDHNFNLIRTISSSTVPFDTAAYRTWVTIPLSTTPTDLEIAPGEIVAGQLTFSSPPPPADYFPYKLSATGQFL